MLVPDEATMQTMRQAASARACLWRLCAEVAERPSEDLVGRLRDGRFGDEIRRHSGWIGEDSPFDELLKTLGAFVNRSARFSADHDLATLREEWDRLDPRTEVAATARHFAELADGESQAWGQGDHEAAKELRVAQFHEAEARLEHLARWCQRLDDDTQVLITQVLVRILAAQVTVESGRDLLGTLERSGGHTATFSFE